MPLIWPTTIHTFFSPIDSVDDFSFNGLRMWGQPKISSCCLCVWYKLKEIGGKGRTRFLTLMAESFSEDLLPAIESYWTESHLEFCKTSTAELLFENMWSAF